MKKYVLTGQRYYLRKTGIIKDTILYFKSRKRRNEYLYGSHGLSCQIVSCNDLSFQQKVGAELVRKVA